MDIIRDKLFNDFPRVYMREIDKVLKKHKNSYIASYYELERLVNNNTIKLKDKPAKPKILNDIPDSLLLEFQSVNPTIECNCCYEDKLIEDFGSCTEGHLICKVCIKRHAENTIFELSSHKIKCIDCSTKCFGIFDEDILKNVLSSQVLREYDNIKKISEMKELSVDDINIKICQHCGAGTDIGISQQELLVCMECFKDTCLKCNNVNHPNKPCYVNNIRLGKQHEIEENKTDEIIIRCKTCNKSLFKEDGCNNVRCICGTSHCNLCKEKIKNYSHFCKKMFCDKKCGQCHLYDIYVINT
jgi:hypothetical protein